MKRLSPRSLQRAAFAPYGSVIDAEGCDSEPINDGTTQRFPGLAALDLRGGSADPVIGIYVAQARHFPLPIARLERHARAAQVFVPLGAHRFIVVVAPGGDAPRWDDLQAFVTAPGQGVAIARGCWHHGLVALGDGDRFAVLEGADYRQDTLEVDAPEAITLLAPA